MTSHKEQPAVDTSAIVGDEVTLKQATPGLFLFERDGRRSLGLKTEYHTPDGQIEVYVAESGEAFWGGTNSFDERDKLIVREVDAEAMARSLAAHPAEPAGMELETTAEQRIGWSSLQPPFGNNATGALAMLARDFDRMRARAEKAEAATAIERERAEIAEKGRREAKTQLRDAQARGKGMEEALKPFANELRRTNGHEAWAASLDGAKIISWLSVTVGDFRRARAALSRPEGSAST